MRRPWSPPACSGGVRIGQWHYTPSPFPAIVSARVLARSTSVPSRCSRRRTRAMKQETRRVAHRAGRLRLAGRCLYTMFARRRLGARETVIRGSVASARASVRARTEAARHQATAGSVQTAMINGSRGSGGEAYTGLDSEPESQHNARHSTPNRRWGRSRADHDAME